MGITKTSISIEETLFNQAEALALRLNISQSRLIEMALENFIKTLQHQTPLDETIQAQSDLSAASLQPIETVRPINQGDVYWLQLDDASGTEPGIPHPHVVIQDNLFNHSRLNTVVVCALTSNIKRVNMPGNILLDVGEANLPKQSVVEVSKVLTVDKMQLGDTIGSLPEQRVNQILAGMRFLQLSFFNR